MILFANQCLYQQQDKGETIMDELTKIFHEKFCYERMNLDGSNRHFYIMPMVVNSPQFIIDWVKEYEKQQSYTEPAITILDKTNPAPVEVIPTKF